MSDLVFDIDNTLINIRVGAILRSEDKVLICRLKGNEYWFMPGGRVSVGESSRAALARELTEEIEGEWLIQSPVATSENFFVLGGKPVQEFCTYYNVKWIGSCDAFKVISHEEFCWIDVSDLDDYPIKPEFVKRLIQNPDGEMSHVIHRDESAEIT